MGLAHIDAAKVLIDMSRKFQDFFYADAGDVTFIRLNENGDEESVTVPNISKMFNNIVTNSLGKVKRVSSDSDVNAGYLYMVDTSDDSVKCVLPSEPVEGDTIRFHDLKSNFDDNNLVLDGNGNKIMGSDDNLVVDVKNANVTIYFIDNNWRVINK